MRYYKTTKCVLCEKDAVSSHGHVKGQTIGALGVPYQVNIIAGFCDKKKSSDKKRIRKFPKFRQTGIVNNPQKNPFCSIQVSDFSVLSSLSVDSRGRACYNNKAEMPYGRWYA